MIGGTSTAAFMHFCNSAEQEHQRVRIDPPTLARPSSDSCDVGRHLYFDSDTGEYQTLGEVHVKGAFSVIAIWYANTNAPRRLVCAPAGTRQEALEIARKLMVEEMDLQ